MLTKIDVACKMARVIALSVALKWAEAQLDRDPTLENYRAYRDLFERRSEMQRLIPRPHVVKG